MIDEKTIKNNLILSIFAFMIFLGIFLYYIEGTIKLGVYPIGIISGITLVVQFILFILSIKNIVKYGFKSKIIVASIIELISILLMGYFLVIWSIIALTYVK